MDTAKEIISIYNRHFYGVGKWMQLKSANPSHEDTPQKIFRQAAEMGEEGIKKLNSLKLSPQDRRHFLLMREAFEMFIKANRFGAFGNYQKAEEKGYEAAVLASEYFKRKGIEVSRL